MFGGSGDVVVKTIGFLVVGMFDALPPNTLATMPKARAKQLIATGQVTAFDDAVPEGARMARYTESDFAWSPNAKKAEASDLTIPDLLKRFEWTPKDFEAAQLCGFPP